MREFVSFLLLFMAASSAVSQTVFKSSVDTCMVQAIVNMDLSEELQKKYKEDFICASAIIGSSLDNGEIRCYYLDDRYDFDLHSIQKDDTVTIIFPLSASEGQKRVTAIKNHSLVKRLESHGNDYIDIDFWNVEQKLNFPPTLDDGLFLKWEIAKQRFMKHIKKDCQGLHRLDTDDEEELSLSKRTFAQLYCIYILAHNETIRDKK